MEVSGDVLIVILKLKRLVLDGKYLVTVVQGGVALSEFLYLA